MELVCSLDILMNQGTFCAEVVSLGMAASNGERDFECIVAVMLADGKVPRVVSRCGVCRELIRFYGPDITVIFGEHGSLRKCRASDLLPRPYIGS